MNSKQCLENELQYLQKCNQEIDIELGVNLAESWKNEKKVRIVLNIWKNKNCERIKLIEEELVKNE
jgi:hypothetical protein